MTKTQTSKPYTCQIMKQEFKSAQTTQLKLSESDVSPDEISFSRHKKCNGSAQDSHIK